MRPPAVAGTFYPEGPAALRTMVGELLRAAEANAPGDRTPPKALIVPHAGYVYSGLTAAHAYRHLAQSRGRIDRVVLLGPAHFVWLEGLALPASESFLTPLGTIPIDREAVERLSRLPQVEIDDRPHRREHSLEVELPFLQTVLGDFRLVPIAVGGASPDETGEVVEEYWDDAATIVVISSDLSHYLDYESARRADARTAEAIESGSRWIEPDEACGCHPINGLLRVARKRNLRIERFDLRNSGDTAGPRSQVVGYGSWGAWDAE